MTWNAEDPCGNEAAKIRWEIVPYTRGAVLDLGCGPSKAFPHFIGIDSGKDTELFGIAMRPDLVVPDCADLSDAVELNSCDGIFSSHLLEHIEDYKGALKNWWKYLKVGGYLTLYLPHKHFYPNIGQPGANPDHKHDFVSLDIIQAMQEIGGWDLVERQDRNEDQEYSFLVVFRKRADMAQTSEYLTRPKHKRTVLVCRYGGFGDMIQASGVLPALKRQGYRITVMTTPKGKNIIEHDPHVDDWYIQDEDQVPNHLLFEFWGYVSKKYTKFINLSESVECSMLAMPGRVNYGWPQAVRHKRMNENYGEFMAELAEVPYANDARFYATPAETRNARDRLLPPGKLNVVWALAGSSVHKFYAGQDLVISSILVEHPECRIFLVGDEACQVLEQGWEKEPRVVCLSGKMGIRDTLALAQWADVVIGCETGVLNAVAFAPNRKVVLLSHSSKENLTKHWVNTVAVEPENTSCYPCHRMHYTWEYCHQDKETGTAKCQRSIHPERVYAAIYAPAIIREAA